MKYLKRITLLFLLVATAIGAYAQNTTTITGMVADSVTGKPVPYSTLSLKGNAGAVKAVLATADGNFELKAIQQGHYVLIISSTGYVSRSIGLDVGGSGGQLKLNTINIQPAANNVKEVAVAGNRPIVKQEIDRISYSMQADPEAKSNTVLDMMRKVPYLSVDGNNNVYVKGKDDFKIFINGRPSSMLERDYKTVLKSMPASTIERIEVITSPSSKYDAEGVGGIINIITTRSLFDGYNATVNVSERFPSGGPNAGGSVAMKLGKFGFSAFGSAGKSISPATGNFKTLAGTANPTVLTQNGWGSGNGYNGYLGTELSYELDSLNLISGSLNINGGNSRQENGQFSSLNDQATLLERYQLNNLSKNTSNGWDASVNYQLGFRKNKNQILTFSYRAYAYTSEMNSDQVISDRINYALPDYKQFNKGNTSEQTAQVDYVQPGKKLTMEAGIKGIFRNNDGNFIYSAYNNSTDSFNPDPAKTNIYINDQQIYALYNTYMFKLMGWGVRAGFRVEQTKINAAFVANNTTVHQDYTNVLGSFLLNKKLNDYNSLSFGLQQRVKRAGLNKLNPFVDRSNPNFETSGNPNLKPAIMNTLQASYDYFRKLSVNLSIDYNFARGLYIPIATYNPTTQVTRTTFENVGNANGLSTNISFGYQITKAWNMNASGGGELISLLAQTNGVQTRTNIQMYRAFIGSGYRFDGNWRVNANMNYASPAVTTLQGRKNAYFSSSFSLNKDLLKNMLSISGSINNPFTKYREARVVSTSADFFQTDLDYQYFRSFNFSVNYKFGKLKETIKKSKRGIRNDDLSN